MALDPPNSSNLEQLALKELKLWRNEHVYSHKAAAKFKRYIWLMNHT